MSSFVTRFQAIAASSLGVKEYFAGHFNAPTVHEECPTWLVAILCR